MEHKFLQSKNWQEEFTSLSNGELKIAAIFTILNCSNCTCRKNRLCKRVLRFLGVRTSQRPKEEFEINFNRVLNKLISQGVFREYNKNKPHPRVKYDRFANKEYLNTLLKKHFADDTTELNPQDKIDVNRLKEMYKRPPRVSAPAKEQQGNSLFDNQDLIEEEKKGKSADEDKIIEDFEDPFIFIDEIPDLPEPVSSNNHTHESSSNIKDIIKLHYGQIPSIKIEEAYPELKLIFQNNTIDFLILIDIYSLQKEVSIKVFIDFYEKAAVDILKLWAKLDCNAAICIEDYCRKEHFVIKRKVDLKRYSKEEIISLIDVMIRAAKTTCSSIDASIGKYL